MFFSSMQRVEMRPCAERGALSRTMTVLGLTSGPLRVIVIAACMIGAVAKW
jgi:hypothetical protein